MTTPAEARQKLAGKTIWLWHYLHPDWQWEASRAWHADRYARGRGGSARPDAAQPRVLLFL